MSLGIERRMLAVIGADFALERFHRAGLGAEGLVIPSLNGGQPEDHPFSGNGVAPLFGGQFLELPLQFAAAGRRRQQRPDDAEAKMRPALMRPRRQRCFFDRMRHFYFFHHFGGAAKVYQRLPALSPGILCGSWNAASHNQLFPGGRGGDRGQEQEQLQKPVAPFDLKAHAQRQGHASLWHNGGMNRARASRQKELSTKRPSHH